MPENLGRRIARLRAALGWTQADLAARLAVSRVAVSHLEAGLSVPGERTVTLLAGLFKLEPYDLVAGTQYPAAKMERLPLVACRYTEVELQLRLLEAELERFHDSRQEPCDGSLGSDTRLFPTEEWRRRLSKLRRCSDDPRERSAVDEALKSLAELAGAEGDGVRDMGSSGRVGTSGS